MIAVEQATQRGFDFARMTQAQRDARGLQPRGVVELVVVVRQHQRGYAGAQAFPHHSGAAVMQHRAHPRHPRRIVDPSVSTQRAMGDVGAGIRTAIAEMQAYRGQRLRNGVQMFAHGLFGPAQMGAERRQDVDRIVVSPAARGLRLGPLLYEDLFRYAKANAIPRVTCEYNIQPANEPSRRFHDKFGFKQQAKQWVANHTKLVSLQAAEV